MQVLHEEAITNWMIKALFKSNWHTSFREDFHENIPNFSIEKKNWKK
jgi:hypothetical protein